jgi:hypothetical protein
MNKRHMAGLIEAALKEIHEVIAVGFSTDYNEDALNDYLRTFADHVASAQKQHDLGELGDRNSADDGGFEAGRAAERAEIVLATNKIVVAAKSRLADEAVIPCAAFRTLITSRTPQPEEVPRTKPHGYPGMGPCVCSECLQARNGD